MKLFNNTVSTVCRPIMRFAEEHALDLERSIDYALGDLLTEVAGRE